MGKQARGRLNNHMAQQKIEDDRDRVLECVRLSSDGAGVCFDQGLATFVPGMLPGEKGTVQIIQRKKNWQRGRLLQLEEKSAQRVEPPCPVYEECGGCQLQHMTYEETLKWKRQWVEDALRRIGKVETEVKPVIGMEEPRRYRNKAVLHRNGNIGYYQGGSHEVVVFPDCLLLSKEMNQWVQVLKKGLGDQFQEIKKITLRQSVLPSGEIKGLALLERVEDGQELPREEADSSAKRWAAMVKEAGSLGLREIWGINPRGELVRLAGDQELKSRICGIDFSLSPLAFLQVNSRQTEVLYAEALRMADLKGGEEVWDLYCGIGTLTLALAKQGAKVTGVEENPHAIDSAWKNAEDNGFTQVSFIEGKVEEKISELSQSSKPEVVVLDPPRAGMELQVIEVLEKVGPERIVYVSCDPGTLARDVELLVQRGYMVEEVQPVDMFPWSVHVECVVLMSRVEK